MAAIDYSRDNGLARITINRPTKRNALTAEDWIALGRAGNLAVREKARAVLIRGAGGCFSSGFDISEIMPGQVDAMELINRTVNPALRAIREIPVPTIAAIEGPCIGGGLGIAAACDVVLASESAVFAAPYQKIGIMADAGLHVFLRDVIGYQRAAYLIFSGKMLSASEALALGLCADVIDVTGFDAAVESFAIACATGPTQAFIRSKSVLRTAGCAEEGLAAEARLQNEVFASNDALEGIASFLEGRKPGFTGT